MLTVLNPAFRAFLSQHGQRGLLAQVIIRQNGSMFQLCHVDDETIDGAALRMVDLPALHGLVQKSAQGAFRPLKSAPNLQRGWLFETADEQELGEALDRLYPGAIADWYAAEKEPPVTSFRDFVNRQTGMYRITQSLTDPQAHRVIVAGCHARFCLKRRFWTVNGLAPDEPATKSIIPCLEPCAVLLEFARTAARLEQQPVEGLALAAPEVDCLIRLLEAQPTERAVREADFGTTDNPRRQQLLIEKLRSVKKPR